jgi:hypothetical protein
MFLFFNFIFWFNFKLKISVPHLNNLSCLATSQLGRELSLPLPLLLPFCISIKAKIQPTQCAKGWHTQQNDAMASP